eukprot:m.62379 g.62379  ORF g.62379 m.62379 type:complete len:179 (+) comp12401_c1_seq2:59-595(+)
MGDRKPKVSELAVQLREEATRVHSMLEKRISTKTSRPTTSTTSHQPQQGAAASVGARGNGATQSTSTPPSPERTQLNTSTAAHAAALSTQACEQLVDDLQLQASHLRSVLTADRKGSLPASQTYTRELEVEVQRLRETVDAMRHDRALMQRELFFLRDENMRLHGILQSHARLPPERQ